VRAEKPKPISIYCVGLASLLMLLLQVFPWSGDLMRGLFNDYDTGVYQRLASWVVTGKVPYLETIQVYPPLDVVISAIPYLSSFGYRSSFIVMNFLIFWAVAFGYWRSVRHGQLGVTSASVVLLGLPAVLYNISTFNDLWVAGAVMLAFLLLRSGRHEIGIALLAGGVFLKSYPLFLLPVAFCWVTSQQMEGAVATLPLGRIRGYAAALVSPSGFRLVASALVVAMLIGGAATLWTGTSWLTVPRANYGHRNTESFVYLLAEYTPLDWTSGVWFARALVAAILLGAFAFIPLRRFDNAVRLAIVVVLAISMSLTFHSPHWNLWFMFLFCLIPISLPLLLLLVVYDINTLLYWPLFSYATPIEVLRPLAREVAVYPIVVQCALKFALIVWLLRDSWRVGLADHRRPTSGTDPPAT
jgi:hypothetical protein